MAGALSWLAILGRTTLGAVIEGADQLASAVTSVLSPNGPLAFTGTLTNALDSVWADFFGASTPPGDTNWNAYTHQQLYDMLWQGADVADVGGVADDWGQHSTALTGAADALRGQGTALRSNWQGRAADQATGRLSELSDRIWNTGARASTVQKAVGNAGDALALARSSMPPPPPDPLTLMTSSVGAGPLPPLGAIVVGGARLFTGDAVAGMSKAEAVKVMQGYEEGLRNSANQVVPVPEGATTPGTYQVDGTGATTGPADTTSLAGYSGGGAGVGGGVPWTKLTAGNGSAQLGPGPLSGADPELAPSALAADEAAVSAMAADGAAGSGGLYAPMGARPTSREQDRPHRNRMPNVNDRFFRSDEQVTVPVIGEDTNKESDGGR